jgi:hypothetical protein
LSVFSPRYELPAAPGLPPYKRWHGQVEVGGEAARPPDVRKASGFPVQTASLLPFGSAGRLSLPAEPKRSVCVEALGKAEPLRTSGGKAALGCYPSGTLTQLCKGWLKMSKQGGKV